jgi:hypothetical protein
MASEEVTCFQDVSQPTSDGGGRGSRNSRAKFLFWFVFETASLCSPDWTQPWILLPQPPECCDDWHTPPHPAS